MSSIYIRVVLIAAILSLSIFIGCSSVQEQTIPVNEASHGETITLLPVVDTRKDKSVEIDPEKDIRKLVEECLIMMGYKVNMPMTFCDKKELSQGAVNEMSPEALNAISPEGGDLLMLVRLRDAYFNYNVIQVIRKTHLEGLLIRRRDSTVLWEETACRGEGGGGVLMAFIVYCLCDDNLQRTIIDLLLRMPESR